MLRRVVLAIVLGIFLIVGSSPPATSEDSGRTGARYSYPGSTVISGASLHAEADPGMTQTVMVTPDPVRTVHAFYEKLLGESLRANCGHGPMPDGSMIVCCNDSYAGTADSPHSEAPRPVEVRVISGSMDSHVFSVTITRAESDAMTHVVVTYAPK